MLRRTKAFLKTQEGLDHETLPTTAPWLDLKPNIDLSLLDTVSKKDNSPEVNKQLAEATIDQYSECLQIYTDGSKTGDEETGAAFHVPTADHSHAIRLPGFCSVFRAELIAIMFALYWLIDNCQRVCTPVVIFSDSAAAVRAIESRNCRSRDSILNCIAMLCNRFLCRGSVTVAWIPAHVGIPGNERVDALAACGAKTVVTDRSIAGVGNPADLDGGSLRLEADHSSVNINYVFSYFNVLKTAADVFIDVERHIIDKWQALYSASKAGSFYRSNVQATVNKTVKFASKIRRKDIAITRLRLGMPALNYYLHRIGVRDSPLCHHCGVDETVEHFIMYCSQYNILSHIQTLTKTNRLTLQNILTTPNLIDCLYDKLRTIDRKI